MLAPFHDLKKPSHNGGVLTRKASLPRQDTIYYQTVMAIAKRSRRLTSVSRTIFGDVTSLKGLEI